MHSRTEEQHAVVVVSRSAAWTAAGVTDRGRVRHSNEDSFVMHAEAGAFVVCDGMGGAAAGETASHVAAETALAVLAQSQPSASTLREAVRVANGTVYDRAQRDRRLEGMGTTMVALSVGKDTGWLGHVGDSRCYRWRGGALERLTQDHSIVEEQIRIGRMTREQARRSPMQNVITRAVGTRADVVADIQEVPLAQGDLYLLASDGLTRELTDAAIASILEGKANSPEAACSELLAAANAAGGRDNITCIVIRIGS